MIRPLSIVLLLLLCSAVFSSPMPTGTPPVRDPATLLMKRGAVDPVDPTIGRKDKAARASQQGWRYFVVRFDASPNDAQLAGLAGEGVELLEYIPPGAWIARSRLSLDKSSIRSASVRWLDALRIGDKIEPELMQLGRGKGDAPVEALLVVWQGESRDALLQEINTMGVEVLAVPEAVHHSLVYIRCSSMDLERFAMLGEVEWMERIPDPQPRNNKATWAIQSGIPDLRPVWDRGIMGQGQILCHIDSLLAAESCYLADFPGVVPGPTHRKLLAVLGAGTPERHGTHTAATAVGYNLNGDLDNAGHAPMARLVSATYRQFIPGLGTDVPQNLVDLGGLFEVGRQNGASVYTNSWGEDGRDNLTYIAIAIDTFTWDNEDVLVTFAATNRDTLQSPENSRNVLAVGATQNPAFTDINGFNGLDLVASGGAGPTLDGRRKPEIYAPGQGVVSADTSPCSVVALSGTSMACPAIAGSAVLVRQYLTEGWYPSGSPVESRGVTPSGALLKAILLNSTVNMAGVQGYPGNREGWGRLLLDNGLSFQGDERRLYFQDERRAEGRGITTGGETVFPFMVVDGHESLRVTLVWNDPPVAHSAATAVVNDLDLLLGAPNGDVYIGNWFIGGHSVSGGVPDTLNNVEQIEIPAPDAGLYEIRVRGTHVEALFGPVGYALVATGDIAAPGIRDAMRFDQQIVRGGVDATVTLFVTSDQGESFPASVYGDDDEEALVFSRVAPGHYQGRVAVAGSGVPTAGNGVLEVGHGEIIRARHVHPTVGVLSAEARVDLRPPRVVSFVATDNRGTSITLGVELSEAALATAVAIAADGTPTPEHPLEPRETGSLVYTARFGGLVPESQYRVVFTLEDVVGNGGIDDNAGLGYRFATARPEPGFMASFDQNSNGFDEELGVGTTGWARFEDGLNRSAPFAYFVPDLEGQHDARLVSPAFVVRQSDYALLTWWQSYEFEPGSWDGGVVEILDSDSGIWVDAGDRLVAGVYTGVIAENPASPISGRPAWVDGEAGGMSEAALDLTAFAGETIRLRWRFVSDEFAGAIGWYIDDVALNYYDRVPVTNERPDTAWIYY